jgi:hypothetical protein
MPRLKNSQQFYGLRLVLFDDLQKRIRRRGYDFSLPSNPAMRHPNATRIPGAELPCRDDILTLIRVAESPRDLSWYRSFAPTVKAFGVLFAKWPDEVLDILCFIRAKLTDWRKNQAGLAKRFLRTHRIVVNNKGKTIAVADMTDKDIARHLTRPGLNVSPDSVKKARQTIAREDREKFIFTEHPKIQAFMRTGQSKPNLTRLLRSHAKGKKQPVEFPFK